MTDSVPKIGDVIREANPPVPWWCNHFKVDSANLSDCRELVASGRWVIVDKQPAAETGPNNEGGQRMRDPHDRRCFQCGHVQHCIDRVIPEVTCRNCGSNDTRPVIRPNHKSEADHLRDRIEGINELFADIRKAVG